MAVEENEGAIVFTGPDIPVFQLISTRLALYMECRGMKHSRGTVMGPVTKIWGIYPVKNRYTKNDKLQALARLDRIIARIKENRANRIEQDVKVVIATVLVEMAEEKLANAEKMLDNANKKVEKLIQESEKNNG